MIFKDTKDRAWIISLDFRKMCRIEDEVGIKILEDPTSLPASPRPYVEMAWIIIEEQAEKLGVDPEDFGSSIDGPGFAALQKAIVTELAVFFEVPRPGASVLMRKAMELQEMSSKLGLRAVERVFAEASSKLQEQSDKLLGDTQPGSLPPCSTEPIPNRKARRKASAVSC